MNIFFTIDLDWCPDFMLDYTLEIFSKNDIRCTIFATHKTDLLKGLNKNKFELSIHPNFNESLDYGKGESSSKIIENLLNQFPNSLGVRSHSMTQSSHLLNQFYDLGLKYESNQFIPYNWDIRPYDLWNNLKRIPYNWEDDIHFLYNKSFDYNINFLKDKFYVLDFHPIHIYLNTVNEKHYLDAKKYYKNKKIKDYINNEQIGVRDFLLKLMNKISEESLETGLLKELI
jgi:hypothetical protein